VVTGLLRPDTPNLKKSCVDISGERDVQTVGVTLISLLEQFGVEQVFGIPGVHTIELYRGLADSSIVHHTPRHEQGAGFMADGYARVSGKPGVCFVITGPGLSNIATAMGQALADSIPMLVISSVNDHISAPVSRGHLHEMPDQRAMISTVSRHSQTIVNANELPGALATAFAIFNSERPGPVHLQLPVAVLGQVCDLQTAPTALPVCAIPDSDALIHATELLQNASAPLLLLGGGTRHASTDIIALAETLDAPAHMTINARGVVPAGHPLALPASGSTKATRALIEQSDVILAIGTELAPTDYDMFRDNGFTLSGKLIRCDIDTRQIYLDSTPDVALPGDALTTTRALLKTLQQKQCNGAARTHETMQRALAEFNDEAHCHLQLLESIRHSLPGAVVVGDSTQLIYSGNMIFNTASPNQWFNSSVGFGTLGYALPAAIGAAIAQQTSQGTSGTQGTDPVVCLIGDGGLQFVLGELGTLTDTNVSVALVVWCNSGYREIKTSMESAGVTATGVDLVVPDFAMIASAFNLASATADSVDTLCQLLVECRDSKQSVVISIDEQTMLQSISPVT
jgi:acetolactate synthase-1/2/3 large subunit